MLTDCTFIVFVREFPWRIKTFLIQASHNFVQFSIKKYFKQFFLSMFTKVIHCECTLHGGKTF